MIQGDIGWVLEGSLEGAIAYLKAIPSKFPDYSNFHIEVDWDNDYRKTTYDVYADRLETDQEFEKRKKTQAARKKSDAKWKAKMKAQKEEKERKELERLKKKYEEE